MDDVTKNPRTDNAVQNAYWSSILAIERMHRQLSDLIQLELEQGGMSDLNVTQALFLWAMKQDGNPPTRLKASAFFRVSHDYNINRLIKGGYLRRGKAVGVLQLAPPAARVADLVSKIFDAHLADDFGALPDFESFHATAKRIERFWGGRQSQLY